MPRAEQQTKGTGRATLRYPAFAVKKGVFEVCRRYPRNGSNLD